jgi:alpha-tubulin suppressor-like RCC1 family protein
MSVVSTGIVTSAGQVLNDVVAITAGQSHALALKSDGTVFAWGLNQSGQATGYISTNSDRASGLVILDGQMLSNVVAIAAGGNDSLALKKDGTVVAWGSTGQSAVPAGLYNVVAVAAGADRCLALKRDGTLVCWGRRRVPAALSNLVAVAASGVDFGDDLALKSDGTVLEWDRGASKAYAQVGASNIVAIAVGRLQRIALKNDGTIFSWGNGDRPPSGLSHVVGIAAAETGMALKSDGTITSWGFSPYHRLDAPAGLSDVVAIAAGDNYCLAITTNRAVAEKFRR